MEDDRRVGDLVRELVCHLQKDSSSRHANVNPNPNSKDVKYAIRILSSRMTPLIVANEAAMANSIKSQMAKQGKLSDALSFADLYSRFASKTGPGSVKNKRAVLYLLKVISEDRSSNPKFQTDRSFAGELPSVDSDINENYSTDLKDNSRGCNANSRALRDQNSRKLKNGGVLFISRDPDEMRDMAYREFATLVNMESDVSEEVLVSDVLSVCQGIDGKYVKFDESVDGYVLLDSIKVSKATRIMIRKLCEVGWLYRKVNGYIHGENVGKVAKAFCSALQDELVGYHKLLTVLQSQTTNPVPLFSKTVSSKSYLSLRRLSVWLVDPMVKMRRMAVLVDSCRALKGGAMAGAIHLHAQHGDPFLHDFMKLLLQKLSSPLFEMVRSWVLEGVLQDLHSEFFVSEQSVKPESLWREGYHLNYRMLPSFISCPLAHKILRTGKSINFLKVCCDDHNLADLATEATTATWTTPRRGGLGLGYGETNALESLVTESAKRIDKHLMDVIFNRYKFKEHCFAIKRYILLGQGDFVQYLMENVEPVLLEPANSISLIHLSGLLQKAILSSSAQHDNSEILDRLKVKMMPDKAGDKGWDVFSLDYNPRVPLNTVFTESSMAKYLRIFNFLWKLRRVEHAVLRSWKTMKPNLITSLLTKLPKSVKFQIVLTSRRCQVLWGQMNHFLINLQSYIMFEVLEVSWSKFCQEMESAKDLDHLLSSHDKYLTSIVEKSILGESSEPLNKTLQMLFDVMLRFTTIADRLYEGIYEFGTGTTKKKIKEGKHSKRKGLETDSWLNEGRKAVTQRAGEFVRNMGHDLEEILKEYSSLLKGFISQLAMQQDIDQKFLLFRLDFTEFYSSDQNSGEGSIQVNTI